jgi:NADPH-dependent 2,4-dienoyl-CoA reductase/sulfur reductase-like enzyme
MVHFGRELIADPDLPNKIKAGKIDEIRKCIRCNECLMCIDRRWAVKCVVNPECGHEFELNVTPASPSKRFVVVGAGVAGMEFASTASKRGHRVTLLEKEQEVGGLARIGSIPAYKNPEVRGLLDYYERLINRTGVDLRLGFTADKKNVPGLKPDAVFIAAGAVPKSVDIKGAGNADLAVTKMQELAEDLGSKICIIGGSGVGLDVGLFLKEKGKDVTVVEMLDDVGFELSHLLQSHIKEMCQEKGIKILTCHKALEITKNSVITEHDGKKVEIKCDNALLAVGFDKIDTSELEEALTGQGIEVVKIGSTHGAGNFMDAIHSSFWNAVEA